MILLLAMAAALQITPENTPDNLKATLADLQKLIQADDVVSAGPYARTFLCDERRLMNALRPDMDPAVRAKIVEMHKVLFDGSDKKAAALFKAKPEQTEIQVHGATTDELILSEKGSVAKVEFPSGARDLALTILRPGLKFYEVEFLEPGQTSGLKLHLFFWDGKNWAMMGPAWTVVKKK